jgi:predicted metal-dependent hydrolase
MESNAYISKHQIGDISIDLVVRAHGAAKSIRLSWDPLGHKVLLTLPKGVSLQKGLKFFEQQQAWVLKQVGAQNKRRTFAHGEVFPFMGELFTISHSPSSRTHISLKDRTLQIEGEEQKLSAVVTAWLRFQAVGIFRQRSLECAEELNVTINKIRVRELRTIWGSCSTEGNLTYSWRLVMAPEEIVHYICAHEVSHLREKNHSSRFWAIVESLCPHYKTARQWLRTEGKTLFQYGSVKNLTVDRSGKP